MTEQLCTDLEHSKLLAETGLMADVEADGYWLEIQGKVDFYDNAPGTGQPKWFIEKVVDEGIKAFRLDKLLLKLPLPSDLYKQVAVKGPRWLGKVDLYSVRLKDIILDRGSEAANAAARLLHLLWKEKLL